MPAEFTPGGSGGVGPAGPTGPAGPQGEPGVPGLNWLGDWDWQRAYVKGDAVGYGGVSWAALTNSAPNHPPPANPSEWALLADKGQVGPQGPPGNANVYVQVADPGNVPVTSIWFETDVDGNIVAEHVRVP